MNHPLQWSRHLVQLFAVVLLLLVRVGLGQEPPVQTGVRFDLESLSKVPTVFPAEDISAEGVKVSGEGDSRVCLLRSPCQARRGRREQKGSGDGADSWRRRDGV